VALIVRHFGTGKHGAVCHPPCHNKPYPSSFPQLRLKSPAKQARFDSIFLDPRGPHAMPAPKEIVQLIRRFDDNRTAG
jgi:hypothetical protein